MYISPHTSSPTVALDHSLSPTCQVHTLSSSESNPLVGAGNGVLCCANTATDYGHTLHVAHLPFQSATCAAGCCAGTRTQPEGAHALRAGQASSKCLADGSHVRHTGAGLKSAALSNKRDPKLALSACQEQLGRRLPCYTVSLTRPTVWSRRSGAALSNHYSLCRQRRDQYQGEMELSVILPPTTTAGSACRGRSVVQRCACSRLPARPPGLRAATIQGAQSQ